MLNQSFEYNIDDREPLSPASSHQSHIFIPLAEPSPTRTTLQTCITSQYCCHIACCIGLFGVLTFIITTAAEHTHANASQHLL